MTRRKSRQSIGKNGDERENWGRIAFIACARKGLGQVVCVVRVR